MGWVLVIEENQGVFEEIKDAIAQFDSKASFVHFPDSHSFLDWMDKLQKHEQTNRVKENLNWEHEEINTYDTQHNLVQN